MAGGTNNVFINCPFDDGFRPSFEALVFGVIGCGFRARCAREMDDGAETRIDKLYRIIGECRYGIHDLSRTELDDVHQLPRFNMPLELGMFLGAKRFGGNGHKNKRCLILDVQQYRFQMFISDLAGMDITAHNADPRAIVSIVRNWLFTVSRRTTIPSPELIIDSYDRFVAGIPEIAANAGIAVGQILFADYERLVRAWVKADHGRTAAG